MRIVLEPGARAGDSFIEISAAEERREELQRRLVRADSAPNAAQLIQLGAHHAAGDAGSQ